MNKTDKNPDYKKIYQIVRKKFNKTKYFYHGPFDETYFSLKVYEVAKTIIHKSKKKCKKEPILVASLLHDVGKIKLNNKKLFRKNYVLEDAAEEWHKHAKLGVPLAEKILKKLGHSEEFTKEVCYLIEHHDQRGEKPKIKSFELKILQDADLIADWGLAGFIRPFLYGCKFHQPVLGSIKHITYKDKRKGHHLINLNISKKIAREKLKTQTKLYQEIIKDSHSDLL